MDFQHQFMNIVHCIIVAFALIANLSYANNGTVSEKGKKKFTFNKISCAELAKSIRNGRV